MGKEVKRQTKHIPEDNEISETPSHKLDGSDLSKWGVEGFADLDPLISS